MNCMNRICTCCKEDKEKQLHTQDTLLIVIVIDCVIENGNVTYLTTVG